MRPTLGLLGGPCRADALLAQTELSLVRAELRERGAFSFLKPETRGILAADDDEAVRQAKTGSEGVLVLAENGRGVRSIEVSQPSRP
jgi:hypothetical protein